MILDQDDLNDDKSDPLNFDWYAYNLQILSADAYNAALGFRNEVGLDAPRSSPPVGSMVDIVLSNYPKLRSTAA